MKTFGKTVLIVSMFGIIISGIIYLSLRFQNKQKESSEYSPEEKELREDIKRCRSVAFFSPKNAENQINWADALSELAKLKNNDSLYAECFARYDIAAKLEPKNALIYNNWAIALSYYANEKFNEDDYAKCFAMYKKATQADPLYKLAYANWAYDVAELADFMKEPKYYRESIRLYKKVAELDSLDASVYNTLGNLLFDLSDITGDEETMEESSDQYKKAISLDPEAAVYHYNSARILLAVAKSKNSLNEYRSVIEEQFLAAESIDEGYACYDLAVFYSRLGMKEEALKWLKKELEYYDYSDRKEIEKNDDFSDIKSSPQFKQLLDEYFQ